MVSFRLSGFLLCVEGSWDHFLCGKCFLELNDGAGEVEDRLAFDLVDFPSRLKHSLPREIKGDGRENALCNCKISTVT